MDEKPIPDIIRERYTRYERGESVESIAHQLGVSRQSVYDSFNKYGLLTNQNRWKSGSPRVINRACTLYAFLLYFYVENGYWPTLREMMPALQVTSSSMMKHFLDVLTKWGWIARGDGGGRNLKLLRPTERGLTREQLAALLAETGHSPSR